MACCCPPRQPPPLQAPMNMLLSFCLLFAIAVFGLLSSANRRRWAGPSIWGKTLLRTNNVPCNLLAVRNVVPRTITVGLHPIGQGHPVSYRQPTSKPSEHFCRHGDDK